MKKIRKVSQLDIWLLHNSSEKNKRAHISIELYFLKAEKRFISQEYHCKWVKMHLLWQCPTQKAVDWQGWTYTAYPKGRASWKKVNAVCIVGSRHYYLFKRRVIERWTQTRTLIWHQSRCLKRIRGMQPTQNYSQISCWHQHIPIYNLPSLEKDRKCDKVEHLISTLREE